MTSSPSKTTSARATATPPTRGAPRSTSSAKTASPWTSRTPPRPPRGCSRARAPTPRAAATSSGTPSRPRRWAGSCATPRRRCRPTSTRCCCKTSRCSVCCSAWPWSLARAAARHAPTSAWAHRRCTGSSARPAGSTRGGPRRATGPCATARWRSPCSGCARATPDTPRGPCCARCSAIFRAARCCARWSPWWCRRGGRCARSIPASRRCSFAAPPPCACARGCGRAEFRWTSNEPSGSSRAAARCAPAPRVYNAGTAPGARRCAGARGWRLRRPPPSPRASARRPPTAKTAPRGWASRKTAWPRRSPSPPPTPLWLRRREDRHAAVTLSAETDALGPALPLARGARTADESVLALRAGGAGGRRPRPWPTPASERVGAAAGAGARRRAHHGHGARRRQRPARGDGERGAARARGAPASRRGTTARG
jgi:hypothetical protein